MTSRSLAAVLATGAMTLTVAPAAPASTPHRHVAGGPPAKSAVLTAKAQIRTDTTAAVAAAL